MIDFTTYKPQRMFLVQGNDEQYEAIVADAKDSWQIVQTLSVSRFTVHHAHDAASFAVEGSGSERILVVYFSVFSPDAAQILLKSLEEPDELTTIVFVTPYPYTIPLTIRSRVMLIQTERSSIVPIKRTREQALAYVKDELSSDSDDDAATRRAKAVVFLDELETLYKSDAQKSQTIYDAKRMLFKANMPTKYVMEYVVTATL